MGFKSLGKNVKISSDARIYNPELTEIGDNSRIDDFCVISGKITIGCYVHIAAMCLLAGGIPGIFIADFCGVSYGVKIFSQTDDYNGGAMTSPLVPAQYTNVTYRSVTLARHVLVGTNAVIFPGVTLAEGCSIGALALVNKSTDPWGIYVGQPAVRKKERKKDMLILEKAFLEEINNDSI